MTTLTDADLLRRYAAERSDAAFAELVRRHLSPVYAFALRRVGGDTHLAEDVAQMVFATLARKARTLTDRPVLGGWLCRTAHFAARDVVRAEHRRRVREQEAFTMHDPCTPDAANIDWDKVQPLLAETMGELADHDRDAVWLRFFEGKSFGEVGARLRLTENAARMRVDRALDKLHAALARRGVTSTGVALGLALASQAGVAAPVGLAASVTHAALAGTVAAAGAGGGWIAFMSMSKLQIGIAAALAVAGAATFGLQVDANASLRREIAALQAQQPALVALRAENRQLAAAAAEVELLRRDDAELKQLAQAAVEIKQANVERARLAQVSAQDRTRARIKALQAEVQDLDRRATEEVDVMNRQGRALVDEHKALSARAKDGTLTPQANAEAEAAAQAKHEEIQAKQAEIKAFIEKVRQALKESPQMAELRVLQSSLPFDPAADAEERRLLQQRAAEVRARSNNAPPSPAPGTMSLSPKE